MRVFPATSLLCCLILAACGDRVPAQEQAPDVDPDEVYLDEPQGPRQLVLNVCPPTDSILASPNRFIDEARLHPEGAGILSRARSDRDPVKSDLSGLARQIRNGWRGFPRDAQLAFCLFHAGFDRGELSAAHDIAELYEQAGQLEHAARYYGANFGRALVWEEFMVRQGMEDPIAPRVSHFAYGGLSQLLRLHPQREREFLAAFREGAALGENRQRRLLSRLRGDR